LDKDFGTGKLNVKGPKKDQLHLNTAGKPPYLSEYRFRKRNYSQGGHIKWYKEFETGKLIDVKGQMKDQLQLNTAGKPPNLSEYRFRKRNYSQGGHLKWYIVG